MIVIYVDENGREVARFGPEPVPGVPVAGDTVDLPGEDGFRFVDRRQWVTTMLVPDLARGLPNEEDYAKPQQEVTVHLTRQKGVVVP